MPLLRPMNSALAACGLTTLIAALGSAPVMAESLPLNSYLQQVQERNPSVKASQSLIHAYSLQENRGSLAFAPFATVEGRYVHDKAPRASPLFQGEESKVATWNVGAGMQTRFGLLGQVSLGNDDTEISGASPTFVPQPKFNSTNLKVEFRQSLLKNGFGEGQRAQEEAAAAGARAQREVERFKLEMLGAQAQSAYWKLAVLREQIEIQRESVQRSTRIRDWTAEKVHLNLMDRSAFLQAETGLKAAELALRNTLDDERAAARDFNKLRNLNSSEVIETLDSYRESLASMERAELPKQGMRSDLAAARESEKAAEARELSSSHDLKAQLDAFASISLQGRDTGLGGALGDSFSATNPTYVAGLSLRMPLDFGLISKLRESYGLETASARSTTAQKTFENDQLRDQLLNQLTELRSKLELADELVKLQAEKFRNEQVRHERGRTTTHQLVMFEQDLATARLSKLTLEGALLQIHTQLKTFHNEGSAQ